MIAHYAQFPQAPRRKKKPIDQHAHAPVAGQTNLFPRILVVDDDQDTRRLYFEVLIRSGYQVDTAEDGEAGWKALQAENDAGPYDLMITDNSMPNLTGLGLIQKMRFAQITLPVILASGTAPMNTESMDLAAVLPKPFTLEELVRTVKAVLHPANYGRE